MRKIILFASTLLSLKLSSQVVINEVAVKPGTSSTASADQSLKNCATPTDGREYIELYNTSSCNTADISCYFLATPNGVSSGAGGTFRFPAGTTIPPLGFISIGGPLSTATIKMNTFCSGANSNYLQTSLSRWFIDNSEAYVALYDANGNALDVVYWTFSSGQSNRWNNASYPGLFNAPANIPNITGICANVTSLAGPSAFAAGIVNYAGAGPNLGTVICRSQDGGSTWITNAAPTINSCNGTCITANPFQTTVTINQPSCSLNNGSITITPNPPGAYTYTWSPNVSSTNIASNLSSGTYSISVSLGGCQKDTVITLNSTTNPIISVNNSTICIGNSSTLTASGANTYSWSPSNGLSATSGATVTANPTVTTTYTITGTAGTCSASTTATLTVNSLPVITVNSGTICAGQQTLTLTAGGASSYTWSPTTGLSTASGATVTASPAVTTTYTITGEDVNNCTNTINSIVSVNPVPTVSISSTKDTICSGKNVTLNASGATNYTWMPGGTTSPSLIVNPANSSTYTVVGSSSSCTSLLETYTIVVNPSPIVTGNAAPYSATCGANDGGIPKITVNGGTPSYSYQWYHGSTPLPNETNDSLNNIAPGTYSVLITDSKGCIASGGATTFTVSGTSLVTASITPVSSQGEVPLNVTFNNLSTGATTYTWSFGNGTISNQQNPTTVIYANEGTYSVTLIASNGNCKDTAYAIVVADILPTLTVPNIFSPNGDAINDDFFINCRGIEKLACNIYNRWGQLIYSIKSVNESWNGVMNNGNKATEGTYFYLLEALSYNKKSYSLQGYITLVK